MRLRPVTLTEARRFVADHHRHNRPPQGWMFGVGLCNGADELLGVAIAGHPVARLLMDGKTVEITRVCTVGEKNANSKLYGAICRAAGALGYEKAITYTLVSESGVSLKAAGFSPMGSPISANTSWSGRGVVTMTRRSGANASFSSKIGFAGSAPQLLHPAALFLALLLLLTNAAPVSAGDETCYPIAISDYSPTGIAGCTLNGQTVGKASWYSGAVAAANWCTWPFTGCGVVLSGAAETAVWTPLDWTEIERVLR